MCQKKNTRKKHVNIPSVFHVNLMPFNIQCSALAAIYLNQIKLDIDVVLLIAFFR